MSFRYAPPHPCQFRPQRMCFRTGTSTKTEGATRLSWSATQNNNPYLIKQRRERERVKERQLLSHNHPSQSTLPDLNIRKQSALGAGLISIADVSAGLKGWRRL